MIESPDDEEAAGIGEGTEGGRENREGSGVDEG